MKWPLISLLVIFSFSVFGQEGLVPISENLLLRGNKNAFQRSSRADDNYIYIFKYDTNHLPIVDDFSEDLIKSYAFDTTNPAIQTVVWQWFLVNGSQIPSLLAMYDTSYQYTFNNVTSTWDSVANPTLEVVLYDIDDKLNSFPIDTDTVWVKPDSILINGILLAFNSADTQYINVIDTFKIIPDEGYSLWRDHNALVNKTYHIDPPSVGVATFDGLDSLGVPYDLTNNPGAYGLADILTSKPVFLKTKAAGGQYSSADSIYFSFFYQPQGRGDAPEDNDSLILQFYITKTGNWRTVWKHDGELLQPFEQVMIKITDTLYLVDGFRFRFLNYATISGNFDQWNIDYIRLDQNRSFSDTIIDDMAFVEDGKSLLIDYSQMPWEHYKAAGGTLTTDEVIMDINNNLGSDKFMRYNFKVEENYSDIYTGTSVLETNFPGGISTKPFDISGFTYPKTNPDTTHSFLVTYFLNANPDANRTNDTVTFQQQFGTQYAYDDGSAENAYFVASAGAQIAVEYNLAKPDTLRAINIYFPRSFESITDRAFRLMVWKSLEPEEVLLESFLYTPRYSGGRDLVQGYLLEEPLAIDGKIYIGIKQDNRQVFIGFDKNNNSQSKNFFKIQGTWANTSFKGSIFIRPEFGGETQQWPLGTGKEVSDNYAVNIYPNPANNAINIIPPEETDYTLQLLNLTGAVLVSSRGRGRARLETSGFSSGVYLVRIVSDDGKWQTIEKVIINH